MVLSFGGDDVRCAPYVTFGTPALAASAVDCDRRAQRLPAGQPRHDRPRA